MEATTVDTRLGQEAVDLLCELIQLDTSNPPNKELPVQELLAERLGEVGFECELLHAEDPERPNLLARLRGDGDGPDPLPARARRHRPGPGRRGLELLPVGG